MSDFLIIKQKLTRVLVIAVVALAAYSCSFAPSVKITVENTTDVDRQNEMVELDLATIKSQLGLVSDSDFIVYDSKRKEIPSQVTYDGKLIFQASTAAMSKSQYKITVGQGEDYALMVFGRQFTESGNDFTWENDMNAVRIVGSEADDRAYGYDIWTKSTPELVVEERYKRHLDADIRARIAELRASGDTREANRLEKTISYTVDHGNGMDSYKVGPSLGGGTLALMERGSIAYPGSYEDYEILDNGPLRLTVKFTYKPMTVGKRENVVETRLHVVDAGTCFTKSSVSYQNITRSTPVVAGIVMSGAKSRQATVSKAEGYIAYADANRRDVGEGIIFVGAIFPDKVKSAGIMPFVDSDPLRKEMGLTGHVVIIGDYMPKTEFVYYWGSMWQKYMIESYEDWVKYVENRTTMIKNPLVVTMK